MFTPDLDLKVITRATQFSIQDKTGVDTGDGTKWSGVAGLDPADLTSAIIRVINPSGVYTDTDVLSQIPSPVTGTWWFDDITGTQVDGLHNIVYSLKTTDFAISAYSNYGTTVLGTVAANATGHGLVTGMYVSLTGTTNYIGDKYVTRIDDNNFYFTDTWVSDDGASTGTIMYKSTFYPYVYSIAEAGIQKMEANLSRMIPGTTRNKYRDDAIIARGLLNSLKSAISSSNTTALTYIQSEITQILSFYDIESLF